MKVILHKLFPYAPYLNEYIGFEDEQRDGETPLETVDRLRKMAEQAHKDRYPELYTQATTNSFSGIGGKEIVQQQGERSREETIQAHITTINECKTLRNLEMFWPMVLRESDIAISSAYEVKRLELTNKNL